MTIIIGAGLSGLLTAYLLQKKGLPFKILEARDRIGGRINTLSEGNNAPVEMGATWFTSQHKNLAGILEELGINSFEQQMDSQVFYQASSDSPTQIVQIPSQAPSFRISGGTANLINTLFQKLDKDVVRLNQSVKQIKILENTVQVFAEEMIEGNTVVLAIPPKLWATNIEFEPQLPASLIKVAKTTQTWMEDSIKIALTYDQPFWEEENIPATLFSNAGPISELYDHSNHEKSKYALCGFINAPLKQLTYPERQARVIKQLKNTFGSRAEEFKTYKECVWSKEKHTFEASETFQTPHQNNGNPIFTEAYFEDRLIISSSESAAAFPGYMEGAIYSAYISAKKIVQPQNG